MQNKNSIRMDDYQHIIENVDLLSMKMEVITQELFDANIDFMAQLKNAGTRHALLSNPHLSGFGTRVQLILDGLEEQTKLLKQEKANYPFKKNLIKEPLN